MILNVLPTRRPQRFARGLAASLLLGPGLWTLSQSGTQAQTAAIVEQCNEFADNVNQNQTIMQTFEAEINAFSESAAQAETLDDITAAATQYVAAVDDVTGDLEMLAQDLTGLTLVDSQLTTYRDDYIEVVLGFSTALEAVNAAMAEVAASETEAQLANNLETFQTDTIDVVGQIETLAVDEADLIDEVNAYCGAE